MTELKDLAKSRKEHALWQELCAKLKEAGAVTEADLRSPLSKRDTPGQRLLHLVREWGEARTELKGL